MPAQVIQPCRWLRMVTSFMERTHDWLASWSSVRQSGCLLMLMLMLVLPQMTSAVPFVDPGDIGPDAPDMLVPKSVFASCTPNYFGLSINVPIPSKRTWETPKTVEYPLTKEDLQFTSSCQHGSHLIEAALDVRPPGEHGMCAATYSIRLALRVNEKSVLNSFFANYCTEWGITSVMVESRSAQNRLAYLTVCGYWNIPSDLFEKGGSVKSFKCEKYPLDTIHERGLRFSDGEVR